MKKYSLIFSLVTFLFILPQVATVYAADSLCPSGFEALCSITNPSNVVSGIVTTLFILAIVLTLFFLIWGGVRWIMAGGDKAKIEQARNTIIAAVVGLVITFLAYFIVNLVTYFVTGQSFSNFNIPKLVP